MVKGRSIARPTHQGRGVQSEHGGELARIRGEDKDMFVRIRRAVALLAGQPYPEGAVAWAPQARGG